MRIYLIISRTFEDGKKVIEAYTSKEKAEERKTVLVALEEEKAKSIKCNDCPIYHCWDRCQFYDQCSECEKDSIEYVKENYDCYKHDFDYACDNYIEYNKPTFSIEEVDLVEGE